jgi:hypothetical protein
MKIIKTKSIQAKLSSEIKEVEYQILHSRKEIHSGDIPCFFVYINNLAWNAFLGHGNNVYKETGNESQGIFIGEYFKDELGEFVIAKSYCEGIGDANRAYVEMSEESLSSIANKCKVEDALMLIWIHTHPNMGVFYSSVDNNCLRANFYMPFQIGLVVDIIRKQVAGFKCSEVEIKRFKDYALLNVIDNSLEKPYHSNTINIQKKEEITIQVSVKETDLKDNKDSDCNMSQSQESDEVSQPNMVWEEEFKDGLAQNTSANTTINEDNIKGIEINDNQFIVDSSSSKENNTQDSQSD